MKEFIDLVCVLEEGIISLDTIKEIGDVEFSVVEGLSRLERGMLVYLELDISILLWFFYQLNSLLDFVTTGFTLFSEAISIGVVTSVAACQNDGIE